MARYYEETALIEFVKKYTPTIEGETTLECVERAIRNAPTADVVPKSEVEQLQRKYDLAVAEREANVKGFTEELEKAKAEVDRLKYNLKAVLEEIPETKREFAREIFEEIYDRLMTSFPTSSFIDAPCTTENRLYSMIAELKKKYTEGEK